MKDDIGQDDAPLIVFDPDGRPAWVGEAARRVLGDGGLPGLRLEADGRLRVERADGAVEHWATRPIPGDAGLRVVALAGRHPEERPAEEAGGDGAWRAVLSPELGHALVAAAIANDVNNPLTWVLHDLVRVEDALDGDLPDLDLARTLVAEARQGTRRASRVLRELVEALRDDDSGEPGACDLAVSLEAAARLAWDDQGFPMRVELDVVLPLPRVWARRGQLTRVLLGLFLGLAERADAEGPPRVVVRAAWNGEQARVTIVSPRALDAVPEGLLRAAREILAGFDGFLLEDTSPGGPRVVVGLRAAASPERPAAPVPPPERRGVALVVEDERPIRRLVSQALHRWFEVVQAASGTEALRRVEERRGRFDVIVCDMLMNDLSGFDILDWLERHHPHLADRVLFMTGGGALPGLSERLRLSGHPWIAKPFDMDRLTALVLRVAAAREPFPG